jgi:hypothetical protein
MYMKIKMVIKTILQDDPMILSDYIHIKREKMVFSEGKKWFTISCLHHTNHVYTATHA